MKENKYVAIMFKSTTCPVCKKMYPYWLQLEAMSDGKVRYYDVTFSPSTEPIFRRFNINDVPTFMVFKDGKLVGRHIGGFPGPDVATQMKNWVYSRLGLTSSKLEADLMEFQLACASCHGSPKEVSKEAVIEWINEVPPDPTSAKLNEMFRKAFASNTTLFELYGKERVVEGVKSMKTFVPNLDEKASERYAEFLNELSKVALGRETKGSEAELNAPLDAGEASKLEASGLPASAQLSSILSFVVGLATGLAAALSPCVFPLFVTHVTSSLRRSESNVSKSLGCGALAALGVVALGALFLLFSNAVLAVQKILLPVVGGAIVIAGLASLLDVPMEISSAKVGKKSDFAFCALYGFLSVQCNLPLVIGALLLIATTGGVSTLAGFALGIGIPLAVTSYLAPKLKNVAIVLTKRSKEIELISSALMVIAGVYLLLYSFSVI